MSVNKFILCQVLGSACAIPGKEPDKNFRRKQDLNGSYWCDSGVIVGQKWLKVL